MTIRIDFEDGFAFSQGDIKKVPAIAYIATKDGGFPRTPKKYQLGIIAGDSFPQVLRLLADRWERDGDLQGLADEIRKLEAKS